MPQGLRQAFPQAEVQGSQDPLPASIFEKSRTSLITVSSASADSFAVSRYSRCSESSEVSQRQIQHAQDPVHRRANLMTHVRQELALGSIRRVRRFFRCLRSSISSSSLRFAIRRASRCPN